MMAEQKKKFYQLGSKDYLQIGRRVVKEYPSIAEKLITSPATPKQTDLSLIHGYYEKLSEENKTERKAFMCAMLHIYQPEVFNQHNDEIYIKFGLLKELSKVLSFSQGQRGQACRNVREVIMLFKTYDDFNAKVLVVLKEVENG